MPPPHVCVTGQALALLPQEALVPALEQALVTPDSDGGGLEGQAAAIATMAGASTAAAGCVASDGRFVQPLLQGE